MKALRAPIVLLVLLFGGCATKTSEELTEEFLAARTAVEYEMVSLGGNDLPVILSNGLVLLGGSCFVNAKGAFEIMFEYKGDAEELGAPYNIKGIYSYLGAADDQAQQPVRFIAREKGMRIVRQVTRSGVDMGNQVKTQRFEAESEGAFFRDGLRIGGALTTITSDEMVFKLVSGSG